MLETILIIMISSLLIGVIASIIPRAKGTKEAKWFAIASVLSALFLGTMAYIARRPRKPY